MRIDAAGQPDPMQLKPDDIDPIDEFRMQHRTAVLVILFTDLKGSTELAEQKGELYSQQVRHRHDEMLREIIHRDGAGRCIKSIGDSLMCIFAEPTSAVQRTVEIQKTLAQYNRQHPDETPMEVRIGMHMGQVVMEGDVELDVFGRHVNRAARIESLADGGQILLTSPVYDSASGWLNQQKLQWADHGRYILKGIKEPARVYEVCAPGTKPRRPKGRRVRETRWVAWAAALLLATIAIPAALFLRPAEAALEARLNIRIRRGDELYVALNQALPLRTHDQMQLIGELSRPAYARIVWLDSNGKAHFVADSHDKKVTMITFPSREDDWVDLEGDPGTELLMLVTSEEPLTDIVEATRQMQAQGPFPRLALPGAIWLSSERIDPVTATLTDADRKQQAALAKLSDGSRAPGKISHANSDKPDYRADKMRQMLREQSASFHGVAVSHL